ncbi:hypothetical protein OIE71_21810 [Streptomyces sp. NBC_01725]|uniref:SCO4983 family protein n=1 Tax=Streptomyces sp. NBC_01725 TaxID=2975923 RepID=UPI002E2D4DC2|nr:hypothetical protein [Streptomyces sp. NBC_01725]
MYEPIRTKSVHSMADTDFPHRTREEELDIQLAGHLAALLAVTDDLGLDQAAELIARQVTRLRGTPPLRTAGATPDPPAAALHRRALDLAGRALVVAASRADTAAAILAAERMDAHTAALRTLEPDRSEPFATADAS